MRTNKLEELISKKFFFKDLLELVDHVLSISEYVLEKALVAFNFHQKLTQSVAQIAM